MHWLDADYALLQAVLCVMTPRSSAMREILAHRMNAGCLIASICTAR